MGLWTQVSRGRAITHPAAYLHRAAVRETVRAMARTRAREAVLVADGRDDSSQAAAPDANAVVRGEQREALRAAIVALSLDRRRAVQGHLAGFSVQELMDLYGWSYQRARNLIARGLVDVRAQLRADHGVASGKPPYGRTAAAAQARARFGPAAAHSTCNAR
jgi:DNA-directed RNA polymerase specialized sigma24 family protein